MLHLIKKSLFAKYPGLGFCLQCVKKCSSAPPKTNINIMKNINTPKNVKTVAYFEGKGDILLYSYENQRKYTLMNVSALIFYLYCANLSYYAVKKMYDDDDEDWLKHRHENNEKWFNKYGITKQQAKYGFASLSAVLGISVLAVSWTHTLRSVKYLFLSQGGKNMTIVTYLPFKNDRFIKVPIVNIKCEQSRITAKNKLELSVKKKLLNYVVDLKGEFRNPKLFDSTLTVMK